jgi:hypothetical protein
MAACLARPGLRIDLGDEAGMRTTQKPAVRNVGGVPKQVLAYGPERLLSASDAFRQFPA